VPSAPARDALPGEDDAGADGDSFRGHGRRRGRLRRGAHRVVESAAAHRRVRDRGAGVAPRR